MKKILKRLKLYNQTLRDSVLSLVAAARLYRTLHKTGGVPDPHGAGRVLGLALYQLHRLRPPNRSNRWTSRLRSFVLSSVSRFLLRR